MVDYTLVVGVDAKHLEQLAIVWPTWVKHKPSLLRQPMLIFFDREQLAPDSVTQIIKHPNLQLYGWPPDDPETGRPIEYVGGNDKWTNAQRHKMLAGYVHVPPLIETAYWLKIDTDAIATGTDDWIDPYWFDDSPAIIAQPWRYTKPPNQMQLLDEWVENNAADLPVLSQHEPLNLAPIPGAETLSHKRIASWCSFFDRTFTRYCADMAQRTCGIGKLPVPSQDGYLWYVARRSGMGIVTANMKRLGWQIRTTRVGITQVVEKAMANM